jgi:hypothetical protein
MDEEQMLKHNYRQVSIAFSESIKLQAHYAELLNMHDGGHRTIFRSPAEFVDRLVETGAIQPLKALDD